jgi:hypothetical protein
MGGLHRCVFLSGRYQGKEGRLFDGHGGNGCVAAAPFLAMEHLQFQLFEPFDSDEADLLGKNCVWSVDSLLGAHIRLIFYCFFFICS